MSSSCLRLSVQQMTVNKHGSIFHNVNVKILLRDDWTEGPCCVTCFSSDAEFISFLKLDLELMPIVDS